MSSLEDVKSNNIAPLEFIRWCFDVDHSSLDFMSFALNYMFSFFLLSGAGTHRC